MSNAELATAARETRLTIAINGTRELMAELESLNNRLLAMKARLLGEHDECPAPINKEIEPDRSVIDDLDYRLGLLSTEISEASRHLSSLEGL